LPTRGKPDTLQNWPLPIAPDVLGDARADFLLLPWPKLIARLVDDLRSGRLALQREDVRFEAVWRHRVPAAALSRLHAYERI
jgi:hypothetical protein